MEKKLRRKFIRMSMLALVVVLAVLFGGINLANCIVSTQRQDQMLNRLAEGGMFKPPTPRRETFGAPDSPESPAMTRFFTVKTAADGSVLSTGLDFISSVSEEDALQYAQDVSKTGNTRGYYGEYRYLIYEEDGGTNTIFLNSAFELNQMRTLLMVSLLLGALSFLIMFILVALLSGRAIAPYVRNMQNQKRFITDASHELKTPLTSIATSADVLALDDENNEWVRNIRSQTQKLAKLAGDLTMLSRLDEETPIPDKATFALSQALWESAEPFASAAKATDRQFEAHIEEGLTLCGDVVAIQRMVSILLDNAVKYTNADGHIRLDAYRKKQKLCIEVFNTCDLIDTKDLNRLFDRFYRGDPSRSGKVAGTGVGLSIAKAIAKAHGGDIHVKSPSGHSITFTVTL